MALPTALLVKGLAGIGAIGGVVGGGLLIKKLLQSKDPNEIIEKLGISGCKLEEGKTKKENCSITGEQLTKIKFSDKAGKEVSVADSSKTLTLTIEKGYDTSDFTYGLRFIFKNTDTNNDLDIGTDSNKITLKANTSYDFRITSDNTKLEKAWDLTTLKGKAGVTCTTPSGGGDITECDLTTGKINVWKSNNDYITEATQTDTTKKISVAKETKDYNGGFKFTVSSDISLTQSDDSKKAGTVDKLTQTSTNSTTYEIDIKDLGGDKGKKWFLVEKPTGSSVPQESQ